MHVLDAEKDKTLTGVRAFLAHPGRNCDDALRIMLEAPQKMPWWGAPSPWKRRL